MEQSYPVTLHKLKLEVGHLKRALKRYGQHEESCGLYDARDVCTCGLERVLDKLRKD